MGKRLPCSACGADPPFKRRGEWRTMRLTRPVCTAGGHIDEGVRIVCGECLLPLRAAWAKEKAS